MKHVFHACIWPRQGGTLQDAPAGKQSAAGRIRADHNSLELTVADLGLWEWPGSVTGRTRSY